MALSVHTEHRAHHCKLGAARLVTCKAHSKQLDQIVFKDQQLVLNLEVSPLPGHDEVTDAEVLSYLQDFQLFSNDRKRGRGGGVLITVFPEISCSVVNITSFSSWFERLVTFWPLRSLN